AARRRAPRLRWAEAPGNRIRVLHASSQGLHEFERQRQMHSPIPMTATVPIASPFNPQRRTPFASLRRSLPYPRLGMGLRIVTLAGTKYYSLSLHSRGGGN